MGLKEITSEDLEQMKKALKLFEFYGVSEEMIKNLPDLFEKVSYLYGIQANKEQTEINLKKQQEKNTMPASEELKEIFKESESLKDE